MFHGASTNLMFRGPHPMRGASSPSRSPQEIMPRRPPERTDRSAASGPRPRRRSSGRRLVLLLVGLLGPAWTASRGSAQALPAPLGGLLVPGGRVSLDFTPSFTTWTERYGPHTAGGVVVDGPEALGADLADPENIFPGIATLQQRIRELSGDAGYNVVVGTTTGRVTQDVKRIDSGIRIGVFDWLTLGVNVPYVKTRSAIDVAFVPASNTNVGVNPNSSDPDAVSTLMAQLQTAGSAAAERAAELCGAGDPACASAQDLADQLDSFRARAQQAYLSAPVFPTGTSSVAESLDAALASMNADLIAAGLTAISAPMAYAAGALGADEFVTLPEDPSIRGTNLESTDGLWTLGDIEVMGALRLLDGEVRTPGATSPRAAWYLAGGALVRLPTGTPPDPSIPFDMGSGDGQMDIEGRVEAALRVGAHLDVHAAGRYGVQQPTTVTRRVALHERVYPPYVVTSNVRWTPGDYYFVELSPRWHLGESLALTFDLRQYHKAQDTYTLVSNPGGGTEPIDARDLEHETEMTLREVAVGVRYSTVASWRRGQTGAPIEVGGRVIDAVDGSGGQAPRDTRVEFSVSVFRRLWGRH